jgi:hypothetical protein
VGTSRTRRQRENAERERHLGWVRAKAAHVSFAKIETWLAVKLARRTLSDRRAKWAAAIPWSLQVLDLARVARGTALALSLG